MSTYKVVVFYIRGDKTTKHSRSLSCFLVCTTRRKCQTNTSRSTLASLDSIQAEVGLTLFILVGLTPHFRLLYLVHLDIAIYQRYEGQ